MPKFVRRLLLCVLLAGSAAAHAADTPRPEDAYVKGAMNAWETPGLSIAVVQGGKVVFAKGYGLRQLGGDTPVDKDTVFATGSISKTFTSAAVAALIAHDRAQWDDRVIDHLADFRLFDPYVTREIRLRDLLSHRSGLPRGEMLWYYSTFNRQEILRRLRYLEPETGFRSAFGYQNLMFVTAGEAVAATSGMSWDKFVAETFLQPLGMAATSTSVTALGDNIATPHARIHGKIQPIAWLNVDNIAPAGGVNSNASDLAKWMLFHLANGRNGDTPLLRSADLAEMRTPQTVIRVTDARRAAIPETLFRAYGLGWYLEDYRGVRLAYHGGRIDGMSSRLTLVPERQLGIAILTNRGRSSLPDTLTYRLLDRYLGAPARDWSTDLLTLAEDHLERRADKRKRLLAQRVDGMAPSRSLDHYAGVYDSDLYGPLNIRVDGATLRLERNAVAIATLSHFNFDTFLASFRSPALRDRLVTFEVDKLGRVAALNLEFEGRFRSATPPLPADLSIERQPGDARTGLAGIWSGRWNGIQPTTLAVERLDGEAATVVYAWGPAPAWGITEGGWERLSATVVADKLTLTLPGRHNIIYNLKSQFTVDATSMDGPRRRHAVLRRHR